MKWCLRSRSLEGVLVAAALSASVASAQPCCATASALFPARLSGEEQAALGLFAAMGADYGALDGTGRFSRPPGGAAEVDLEQRVLAAFAPIRQLQVNASVPFVETWRSAAGYSELGGGIGDMLIGARGIAYEPGNAYHLPGISLLAAVTAPTGRSADEARRPLATDFTGQGTWQVGGGLDLEEWVGAHVVLELTGSVVGRLQRTVGPVHSQLAPQLFVGAAGAWVFDGNQVLALSATVSREGDASVNGARVPGSGRGLTTVSLFGALPLPEGFRLQGSVGAALPALGVGQSTGVLLTAVLLKAW
jgi:hypothetical protein